MADEECINASQRRKIEETVLQILNTSDLETATEFCVRAAAAERLGLDLSSLIHRRLVRQLIDSFLLSTATDILSTTPSYRSSDYNINCNNNNSDGKTVQTEKQQQLSCDGVNYDGKIICQLSDSRRVTIHDFGGSTMVSIRDFYIKDGNMLPRKGVNTGLSLTGKQWSSLRNSFTAIEEAIVKLDSRLRSKAVAKQSTADMTNSATDSAISNSQGHILAEVKQEEAGATTLLNYAVGAISPEVPVPSERKQAEATISNSEPPFPTQLHDTVNAISPEVPVPLEKNQTKATISNLVPPFPTKLHDTVNAGPPKHLIPIQTSRLDGRNYHSWKLQMDFFLNQLNIAYVLVEQNPSMYPNPEDNSDENVKRWIDDDYLCRHNILNSLSDNLFQFYSQNCSSARELWEKLKSAYDDDFGTKRSQINKYIHFQMVDGLSIIKQVQELHKIADSIWANGTWIDENFHASVIVSKLPPSWKEFRARLMHEDFLPMNMLMHRLQIEEESRRCYKKETNFKKRHISEPNVGMRKKENKRLCYSCGKEGHISKSCPKNFEAREKSNGEENRAVNTDTDTNAGETVL